MVKTVIGSVPTSLYWIRARLTRAAYDRVPRILAVRTNTVGVIQARDLARRSSWRQHWRAESDVPPYSHSPVLLDSLIVEVDEGAGFTAWRRVDDFFSSGPQRPGLRVERDHRRGPIR